MQRAPPGHGEMHDRQIDRASEAQDRRETRRLGLVLHRRPQGDVADIGEKQHEHGRQACVPYPPGAPCWRAPQRAGDQAQASIGRANRGRCARRDIRQRVAPDQTHEARDRHEHIDAHRPPGCRHMHIHDPHRCALHGVLGGKHQRPAPSDGEHRDGGDSKEWQRKRREAHEPLRIGEPGQHERPLFCESRLNKAVLGRAPSGAARTSA